MEALISIDPDSHWTTLPSAKSQDDDDSDDDEDRDPTVADMFSSLLGDSSHEIRMYLTKAIKW